MLIQFTCSWNDDVGAGHAATNAVSDVDNCRWFFSLGTLGGSQSISCLSKDTSAFVELARVVVGVVVGVVVTEERRRHQLFVRQK